MKRLLAFTLASVFSLSVFAACDKRRYGDSSQEKTYSIEAAFETKIEDGNHNADVKFHKVVFKDNEALTDAVNGIIYEPFYARYAKYCESAPVAFNFFRGENMIYESGDLLSIASLSYRQGTYIVFPHIAGTVIDLKNNQLLTAEELLQKFNTSSADVAKEVRRILPELIESTSPMILCDLTGAYLNAEGELITIFSTERVLVDMPSNPTLYYNVTTKEICTHPAAESFEMLDSLYTSLPENQVFDEGKYNKYYKAYEEITARIPKYRLDISEIKDLLITKHKDSYTPGTEITVTITTESNADPCLWVNEEKHTPTDRNSQQTTFTFVMPNRDVKLKIEGKNAGAGITEYTFEIPLGEKLDYIVPAAIYGEIHPYVNPDRYTPSIRTNEYSPDGVGYVTFGIANDMKPPKIFSKCYTYRITQEGGYIVSVEEVETITKETVLQSGTPYSGNSFGKFTGVAYDRTRTATVSGNEISVGSYQSHTDAGGTYAGMYSYNAETGDFSAELSFQYHDNGNFVTNEPASISGKLYEYGGFIHFVCENSDISTVDANEALPMTFYPMSTITNIADWEKLPWSESWERWRLKPASNSYNFICNLVSGESKIPEYNGLGIRDYSITLVEDEGSGIGTTLEFTFTVTDNSLPETLPPGTYTKIVGETVDVFIHDKETSATDAKGLNKFGDNSAVQAVNTYLSWMPYIYEVSPYGEWYPENYHLPYNYICAYYGNESLEINFSELQRLMSEKFGITVERPDENRILSHCKYNAETDTVYYADTRGYLPVHRFLDVREEGGITYVTVQLFADQHFLLPSHKVQYAIGEGDVFLGCEIIKTGNYAPREIS